MSPESQRDIIELAEQLCGGVISDADQARLNQCLREDAEAQRVFLSITTLHAGLLREFADDPTWVMPEPSEPNAVRGPVHGRIGWGRRILAMAAGIAIAVSAVVYLAQRTAEPIAT